MDNDSGRKEIKYNPSFEPFLLSQDRYCVLIGGAGSSKSFTTAQKILFRTCSEQKHRFLCVRKVADSLRRSVFQLFNDMIIDYSLSDQFYINKTEMKFLHTPTGNEIILSGMDDSEKIKSIAGITGVWCEEATELEEGDFNQLELRVRGETSSYKQFILTFNPIDENHWLKKRFFDHKDNQVFIFKSTYKDNLFLDDDYIRHLTERVRIDENLHRIYVLGEWGRERTGGEFYKHFNYANHVRQIDYNPELPLHISFDENVNPYFPCCIFQIDGKKIYLIKEVLGYNPNNTVGWITREIKRICREWKHSSGVFIYGDATSQKDDVKIEKGYDLYRLIMEELAELRPIRRVHTSNPSVVMAGNFFNAIFLDNYAGIEFYINESCKKAIDDFSYTKEASDGRKDKTTVRDPKTKVSYQPFGHISDLSTYLLTMAFSSDYSTYQRGGSIGGVITGHDKQEKVNRF